MVIPFYNKGDALKEIHAELKLQINPDDEILIIDDWSPSGVPELNCGCTRVVKPEEKLTPHLYRLNTLRNIGIREAKTDCVIILDPDCKPNPDFLRFCRILHDPAILYTGCVDRFMADGSISLDHRVPERVTAWIDTNPSLSGGGLVWGGVMMFSKNRTALSGFFDEEFDGEWGAEEHEFASRCYHAGIRLCYSMEMKVTHLYHPPSRPQRGRGSSNMDLWRRKSSDHARMLNMTAGYNPAVGVSVITMMRPKLIDQCLRSIFRGNIPVRVRLDVNGDDSAETKKALFGWRGRWCVDVVEHKRDWPAKVRNRAFQWARDKQLKYLIQIDDDMVLHPNAVQNLVHHMEQDPSLHALSGSMQGVGGNPTCIGGPLIDGAFSYYPPMKGVRESDWVGGGFTIHRVNPIIPYDERYETGYNDYDWSMVAKKDGMKLGVTGDAGSYHAVFFTPEGMRKWVNPPEYSELRYSNERFSRMRALFKEKWGFEPRAGGVMK